MPQAKSGIAGLIKEAIEILQDIAKRKTGYQELKFWIAAMKELSHAREIFREIKNKDLKIMSAFGSARTPEDHPAYMQGVELGKIFADANWKVLSGAGDGIMKSVHVGATREHSLGINIQLPFEQSANEIVKDSAWLVAFKFFFGRKITFAEQSDAIIVLEGGFGTFDEAYEILTLMQTGKADLRPFVFLDVPGGTYWKDHNAWERKHLFDKGYVSPEDENFYRIFESTQEAYDYCKQFYNRYHSMYHLNGMTHIRLQKGQKLTQAQLNQLNDQFKDIIIGDKIEQKVGKVHDPERRLSELSRLVFNFKRSQVGKLRMMIDVINAF